MNRILVVDDDAVTCELLADVLRDEQTVVVGETDPRTALDNAGRDGVDLAIIDVQMPEMDGITLLRRLRDRNPDLPVIVMTAFGSIDTAVRAIDFGAVDYVSKPMNVDEIRGTVRRVLDRRREPAADLPSSAPALDGVVGRTPAMVEIYKAVARVAPTSASVLILGETGTGKEVVARAIHRHSPRHNRRFLAVDCAALSETLLESELFGHVRGAFTGAVGDSPGLFAEADGGTIFLDEIGDVSPAMQARLLRVLQEREVRPVGGTRWRPVDVRVIAATHRDLAAAVAAGRFREDLYYRLQVVTIALPPLRERRDDIPLLVEHFVRRAAAETGRPVIGVSQGALAALAGHGWPGNVRELSHVVERAVVLARHEVLTTDDFAALVGDPPPDGPPGAAPGDAVLAGDRPTLREMTRRYVLAVLEENAGNVSRAATVLGIDRRSLHRMLKRYGGGSRA
ncbi:MAG TPA: sigma-54 dependent transcriptional regulator [Candidatus Binatia bacterium]|nr:sigma-54 dependent transcriptional regulator [Candidatus Binatia bacterium]